MSLLSEKASVTADTRKDTQYSSLKSSQQTFLVSIPVWHYPPALIHTGCIPGSSGVFQRQAALRTRHCLPPLPRRASPGTSATSVLNHVPVPASQAEAAANPAAELSLFAEKTALDLGCIKSVHSFCILHPQRQFPLGQASSMTTPNITCTHLLRMDVILSFTHSCLLVISPHC